MRNKTMLSAAVALLLSQGAARADLVEIPALPAGSPDFSFFVVKNYRKTTVDRARADLLRLLAPLGRTPCMLASDRGALIGCNDGVLSISSAHLYSYNLNQTFPTAINELRALDPDRYKGAKLPDGVGQTWSVNFVPPPTDGVTPCTGLCNQVGPVTLTFSRPVSAFSLDIDVGDQVQLTSQLRVLVNGQELLKDMPALGVAHVRVQDLDAATGAAQPISSVTIEPIGGATSAFLLDRISYSLP